MRTNERKITYILIGRQDDETNQAKEILDGAGVRYGFAYGDPISGPLPQLVSGLSSYIGLDQIIRLANRLSGNNSY